VLTPAPDRTPWRASLVLRRRDALLRWLTDLRERLARVPRRVRRALGALRVRRERPSTTARRRSAAAAHVLAAAPAFLAWLLATAPVGTAEAATITVGAGGCTLPAAITNANNDDQSGSARCAAGGGADTINFAQAGGTYDLSAALPFITTPITIQGNGNTTIRRVGGPPFHILRVHGLYGSLALEGATISGGVSGRGHGGGIFVARGRAAEITGSTISGNTATFFTEGGGIYNAGTLTLRGSTVTGNYGDGGGGGISNAGGVVTLVDTAVSGNRGGDNEDSLGGGILNRDNGTMTIVGGTISGNSAHGDEDGGGGGIRNEGTLSIEGATVAGNTTHGEGGGISSRGPLRLARTTVSGNSSATLPPGGRLGGGIYVESGTATLENSTISGNRVSGRGGGLAVYEGRAVVRITDSTIVGNTVSAEGGGIYFEDGSVAIAGSTIADNSASRGGGIFMEDEGTITLSGSIVAGNRATGDGGGIVNAYKMSITDGTISGNSAGARGGGIFNTIYRSATLTHVTLTGNAAAQGGGIYNEGDGEDEDGIFVAASIVADQAMGGDCAGSPLASLGYNIESGRSCGFTATGDQRNVGTAQLDLGPLALNPPGTTRTHALGAASVALDRVPPGAAGCGGQGGIDQRGVPRPRPAGGGCDVGAFELEPDPNATPRPPGGTPSPTATSTAIAAPTVSPSPSASSRPRWIRAFLPVIIRANVVRQGVR